MKLTIDLNCDLGEGSPGVASNDEDLLRGASSANIACGFHAGDAATMHRTVQLCKQYNVAIGAHPGFPDRDNFGRREMDLSSQEIYEIVLYQIGALHALATAEGCALRHVKPHGALYNMSAVDQTIARAIAKAVHSFDPSLALFGLAGSESLTAAQEIGLTTVSEVFADRTYQSDGTLTPRNQPDALLHDPQFAADRIVQIMRTGKVLRQQGTEVALHAESVCIHGDGPNAVAFGQALRTSLIAAGVVIQAPVPSTHCPSS